MRSIAIINQKGGVGKTTTAVNLAAGLARLKKSVLLLDLDQQCHASIHTGVIPTPDEPTIFDVLTRDMPLAEATHAAEKRLAVVPSHRDLVGIELTLAQRPERETILARVLRPYQEGFDYCIIDCGPSLGLLTVNVLAAVHEVIIPLQPHFLALQGLGELLQTVAAVRAAVNPSLRVSGVVLCMFERGTKLAQEVSEDVRRFVKAAGPDDPWHEAQVFKSTIRRNIKLAECPSFGQTIFAYAPTSHGAEDYAALAKEVAAMKPRHADATPSHDTPDPLERRSGAWPSSTLADIPTSVEDESS